MRIVLATDTYPPEINGVATSTYNLCKTLKSHGHEVLILATNPSGKETIFEDGVIRIPGIELKQLYGYRASPFYNRKAMKALYDFKPDVIHCQTDAGIGIFGMLAAARMKIGTVYTFHTMIEDYAYYVTKGHFDRFARHSVRWFYRRKSELVTEFIAPSEKIKDYLRSIGIDRSVTVIPTGIEFDRFSRANENLAVTQTLKKKFGIKPNEYVLLSLGRIAKEKSIDVILRGYADYLKGNPSVPTKFLIVGLGPAEEELKLLSAQLGIEKNVIFAGKCAPSETQKYYHLGDCFASASITETQGLTFMEAMAAELPVLARYDDNLVGTIQDGTTGFFFTDDTFAEKFDHVIKMGEEEKKRIQLAAMKAIEPYSMERFYQNIIEVYKRVSKKHW